MKKRVNLILTLFLTITPFLIASGPLFADPDEADDRELTPEYYESKGIKDKFSISIGLARTAMEARAQVNSSSFGLGTSIVLDDTFNLEPRDNFFRGRGYYRFNKRHRIDFGFFTIARDGEVVTTEPIDIGDETIPAGTFVAADTKYEFFGGAWSYAFVNTDKIESGISLGLTVISVDLGFLTSGIPGGGDLDIDVDVTLPLPVAGVYTTITLRDKLFLNYAGLFFVLDYDAYAGTLLDARASIDWYPFRHIGFGLGFVAWNLDVTVEDEDKGFNGFVDLQFRGFNGYVTFIF